MKAAELFKEYVWLVNTISRAGALTLRELNERWLRTDMSEGVELSRSTFNRHRAAVEDIFGIIIDCDSQYRYYIYNSDALRDESVQNWMLSTMTVSNIVSEARGLHDRILLELIPSDGEHLRTVVDAMRRSVRIAITYRRYGVDADSVWTVEPYCIKLFRRRWYLLCRYSDKGFVTLSFDRIRSIELTEETFAMPDDFDAQTWFSQFFGVMTDDRVPVERIVLRAFGNERYALPDLPLHHSQKKLKEGDDYVDFELRLRPTSDFIAQILSRGRWVKVLEPESIAQKIKQMHIEAAEN
ncbi:MAG: WYL domain-containing protein [Bacteroidales bacterium]|nr:WYL domain-containing protein [Bacteroidales bacterium]